MYFSCLNSCNCECNDIILSSLSQKTGIINIYLITFAENEIVQNRHNKSCGTLRAKTRPQYVAAKPTITFKQNIIKEPLQHQILPITKLLKLK